MEGLPKNQGAANNEHIAETDNEHALANKALQQILKNSATSLLGDEKALRTKVVNRMLNGASEVSEDKDLKALFDQVAEVEDMYGRDVVAEMAGFYVMPNDEREAV